MESKLFNELKKLSLNSSNSVQNGDDFTELDKYMHVVRPIENKLISAMEEIDKVGGGIVLLVGSAGDGKSHLISRIKSLQVNDSNWNSNCFYNDATASCSPMKTSTQTLIEALSPFNDANIGNTNEKLVLAINIGKLCNFVEDEEAKIQYSKFVEATKFIFNENVEKKEFSKIKIVLFSEEQIFEFYPEKLHDTESFEYSLKSEFLSKILDKITEPSQDNPFHCAYLKDKNPLEFNPVIINYELLRLTSVKNTIVMFVIEAIIRFNLKITVREFLDFIYSIVVEPNIENNLYDEISFDYLLPNLIFKSGGNNIIQKKLSLLDPLKYSNATHDEDLSILFTSVDLPDMYTGMKSEIELPEGLISFIQQFYTSYNKKYSEELLVASKFIFRLKHIINYHSDSDIYKSYLSMLGGCFTDEYQKLSELYEMINTAIPRHYGLYYEGINTIPLTIQGSFYHFFVNIELEEEDHWCSDFDKSRPNEFQLDFWIKWYLNDGTECKLKIDYKLYTYIYELTEGKLAIGVVNERDLVFDDFIRKLLTHAKCNQAMKVVKIDNRKEGILKMNSRKVSLLW